MILLIFPISMLVDCWATTHILNDKSKSINFAKDFDSSCYIVAYGNKYDNLIVE